MNSPEDRPGQQKRDQREILCGATIALPRVWTASGGRKLPLRRRAAAPFDPVARREPRPPEVLRLGRSLALPRFCGLAGASPSRGFAARPEPRPPEVWRLGRSLALPRFGGSPLDDSVRGVFRGQNTSLHRVLHFALSQKNAAVPGRDSGAGRGEISRSDQAAAESRRGIFRSPRTISSVTTNF